jgi:hypothetical protein
LTVRVIFRRDTLRRAEIELSQGEQDEGGQELTSTAADCGALSSAVALAVSIAIDAEATASQDHNDVTEAQPSWPAGDRERAAADPAKLPGPTEPATTAPVEHKSTPPTPGPLPGAASRLRAWLASFASFHELPATTWGLSVGGEATFPGLSLGLELRGDVPQEVVAGPGVIRAWTVVATFAPCIRARFVFGCPLLSGGALFGQGEHLSQPGQGVTPYAAAGGRLGFEVPGLATPWLRVFGDVSTPLTPTSLGFDGTQLWRTPSVSALLGVGAGLTFQ